MSSEYPDEKKCLEILRMAGCDEEIIAHCICVKEMALKIARRCRVPVNLKLVTAGALLHDIGRSVTHGVAHGVKGSEIARKMGLSEDVVRIIERHVGGGIDAAEAAVIGLPARDFMPETVEEKIVCLADKLIANNRVAGIEAEVRKLKEKGLHVAAERVLQLYREIVALCGEI
ncbi:MAG: HDIG domain-containing metalloprotein [Thermoplasmata archaeon]